MDFDDTGPYWIRDRHEHDWHAVGERLQRRYAWRRIGKDNVGRERNQFGRVSAYALRVLLAPADVETDIDAIGPACLLQDFLECCETGLTFAVAG